MQAQAQAPGLATAVDTVQQAVTRAAPPLHCSLLAAERLPPEYAGRCQTVLCNDCSSLGAAPFHFVYHKCPSCASYNTRVVGEGA